MEHAMQKMAAVSFLIIGLSHAFQHRAWAEFFVMLRQKGEAGVFAVAFIHLPVGALIVAFHNVWSGLPLVLTIAGWGWVVKSLLYFVYPKLGGRMLARVSLERSREFIIPGILLAVYGGLLAYHVLAR
jgi:hypothetical protein